MAQEPTSPQKPFPVSWDQFHRDSRALAWRLSDAGPFAALVCITRGGLVPAAIVARELGIRVIETVCVASYDHVSQGELKVLKTVAREVTTAGGGRGKGVLVVDDLVDTGQTARVVRELALERAPQIVDFLLVHVAADAFMQLLAMTLEIIGELPHVFGHFAERVVRIRHGLRPNLWPLLRGDQAAPSRIGGWKASPVSQGKKIQVSCDTSDTKVSTSGRPIGLA